MDEKQITIMDENGNERIMEILFTYEHPERKKKYVFLYEKDNPEEVIAMEYNDNGELFEIESGKYLLDFKRTQGNIPEYYNYFKEIKKIIKEKLI